MEKYYISCDMEGITGISNFKEMEHQKQMVSKMMTDEIKFISNAINHSRLDAGKSLENVEITVADSHSMGMNVSHAELPPNVRLIRGFPRSLYMTPRIDPSYKTIMFAGYHARSGSHEAGMDHTFSGSAILGVMINGHEVGEFEINAGLAGHYGVPCSLAAGDDKFIGQIEYLRESMKFETVVTKEAISRYSAILRHPEKVYHEFSEKIDKTLNEQKWAGKPLKYEYPLKIAIELTNTVKADMVALVPVLKRTGGRTIEFEAPDFPYFYNMLCAITLICWNDK